mmetsp:Transcript_49732/g.143087  ORF Transcript_49732/g.143087 Transcript_49732/m.143087 type:complete len:202 (+) Transcript_49732:65-670(+)
MGMATAGLVWITAALVSAGAIRRVDPAQELLEDDMTVDETGAVYYPNGTKWTPFLELSPNDLLPRETFVCHEGSIFGVQIPTVERVPGKFYYLQKRHVPQIWPLQVFADITDPRNDFMLLPPLDNNSREWQLLVTFASEVKLDELVMVDRYLFPIGEEHPCGPAGDWEAEVAARVASHDGPRARFVRRGSKALWNLDRRGF